MGVQSLNDLAVDGTFNTTNQPKYCGCKVDMTYIIYLNINTVEPLLRSNSDKRPTPLERPHDNVNLNIYVLISTPDERPPLLKGHISDTKEVALQEGL